MIRQLLFGVGIAAVFSSPVRAVSVFFESQSSLPSLAAIAAGVPSDAVIFQLFVTTDTDIVAISDVAIVGKPLYQTPPPLGSNSAPPNPAFIPLFPQLSADSWITTPGSTALFGADLPGDGMTTFGDITDDGPQNHFQFAQLTFSEGLPCLAFSGAVVVADPSVGHVEFPFYFAEYLECPEPSSILAAAICGLGLAAAQRRRFRILVRHCLAG
ncbi:MAG: hypothetical protein KDA44_03420 [Planctomycetales bacterium]|nr:hypothetical protein [Planctomycetales bacterium]